MSGRRTEYAAIGLLLLLAAMWGSTFFLIHDLTTRLAPGDFLTVRFAIAALALFLVAPRRVLRMGSRNLRSSLVLGLLYGVAQVFQTEGIARTPASIAGFLTGLYVILTPLIAAPVLRTRISRVTWMAVGLAIAGLATLSLNGLSMGLGHVLILASAVFYACHIVALGAWSTPEAAFSSTVVQSAMIAAVALVLALPGGIALPASAGDWASMLYMALAVSAIGLLVQTWAQAHLAPTKAALSMAMEPVFAAGFAVAFGGESATVRMVIGGLLVMAAILIVELVPHRPVSPELHPPLGE